MNSSTPPPLGKKINMTHIRSLSDTKLWRYYPPAAIGKLSKGWVGPYKIIERPTDVNLVIQEQPETEPKRVHVDSVKQYHGSCPEGWENDESGDTPNSDVTDGLEGDVGEGQSQTDDERDEPESPQTDAPTADHTLTDHEPETSDGEVSRQPTGPTATSETRRSVRPRKPPNRMDL